MTLHPRIAPALARALDTKGYDSLTEVQTAVLDETADGADLLVSAQTGSGKTVAFGLAIAPTLLEGEDSFGFASQPLALVVAPTRELALQVQRELIWLFGEARGRIASCVGGMDPRAERRALERGAHIVVGTPGRLRDHIERGALDMSALRAVVLDEADEMLDFGFREDLEFILDAAPAERRTLLFSATVPPAIADIAQRYQTDAQRISTVSEKSQHADIEYKVMTVAASDREKAIINILRFHDADRAIVFCSTREAVNRLASRFGNRGFSAVALSGELSQNERTHALQALRDGRARVCIATDVAARGIDLPGLELVIHADLPMNSETLLHRSGRTGRAGRKGTCALIVPYSRKGRANRLLREGGIEAQWSTPPSLEDVRARDRERMFEDESLSAETDEEQAEEAKALLERYGAEAVASAFLAKCREAMPAAEDLMSEDDGAPAKREPREPFTDGVWFHVSAGRKHRAEPRWLLPLICRVGDVTRKDVGSIQIGESVTRVEISGAAAEAFMRSLEANGGGEKNIRITQNDAEIEMPQRGDGGRRDFKPRDRGPRRPHRGQGDRDHNDRGDRGNREDRGERGERRPRRDWKPEQNDGERQERADRDATPHKSRDYPSKGPRKYEDRPDRERKPYRDHKEDWKGKDGRKPFRKNDTEGRAKPTEERADFSDRDTPRRPKRPGGPKPYAANSDGPKSNGPKSRDTKPGGKPFGKPRASDKKPSGKKPGFKGKPKPPGANHTLKRKTRPNPRRDG